MTTQIFKRNVPNEALFSLLEDICLKNDTYYVFDINSFKKGVFHNKIQDFFDIQFLVH